MKISQEGLSLIKKFEGCELEAYKCAANVWTIGYGSLKESKKAILLVKKKQTNYFYMKWKSTRGILMIWLMLI